MKHATVTETFLPRIDRRWNYVQVGGGQLLLRQEGLRLLTTNTHATAYADAQLDDYARLPRHRFPWRPPLQLHVCARASGQLTGTAGFGFWNNPFSPLGGFPALPAALWFFHASPPSDMPLAVGVPGLGWKCATIDATTAQALRWTPFAPPVVLLNRIPAFAQRVWPRVQHDLGIAEAAIPALDQQWRDYLIDWQPEHARFYIDGELVFHSPFAPNRALGFVAWLDNQWAVVTPQGRFGWGLLDAPAPQWLDLARITIQQPAPTSCGAGN